MNHIHFSTFYMGVITDLSYLLTNDYRSIAIFWTVVTL
ncbi:hypothetical protein N644_2278 [Lactiplantibacillus paraplantarum]|nr:hypothetical protein N644_2278 [Lactiplantibacillus paraplantarum]